MISKILSVIAGYAVFVTTSLLLFKISGQNPHADPTTAFVILTTIYGVAFSIVAGIVTKLVGRTADLKINFVLAMLIAGFATFSLFKSGGNHWTQLLAIFIFAPASIFGGLFYNKEFKK